MRILTKTLLAWLLVCAIPVQGFAATAARLLDAPAAQHRQVAGAATKSVASSHCTHGQASAERAAPKAKLAHGTCSACAACCLGAALIGPCAVIPVALLDVGAGLRAGPAVVFVSHIPEGLDPPPRAPLA